MELLVNTPSFCICLAQRVEINVLRVALLAGLFCNVNGFAQKRDFWGIQATEAVYRISPRCALSAGEQILWNQNATNLKTVMGDFALGFKCSKDLTAEIHYRPIGAIDARQRWLGRNMLFTTLTWNRQMGKWTWSIRERIQRLGYNDGWSESYRQPKAYNRLRVGVKFQRNYYWSFMANVEGFLPLLGVRKYLCDQLRSSFGVGYHWNKHWRSELSYGLMQQLNRNYNRSLYFTMLATHYYF